MGLLTNAPRKGRVNKNETIGQNTVLADLTTNKGTLLFSADLLASNAWLINSKVSFYVGEDEFDPFNGRVFIVPNLPQGRTVTEGKITNAKYFIQTMFDALGINEDTATFTLSTTAEKFSALDTTEYDMFELVPTSETLAAITNETEEEETTTEVEETTPALQLV